MPHSSQLTEKILTSPNPIETRNKLWEMTRYLIAQKPVTEESQVTDEMHYLGRVVIPGPKADPVLCGNTVVTDPDKLADEYGITFVDFATTAGADQDVTSAPFTIMSKSEADDYEKLVRALQKRLAEERRAKAEAA